MAVKRVSNSNRSQSSSSSASAAAAATTASATPLSLSPEHEMVLMEALLAHKPAGMHKHFRMAVILEIVNGALYEDLGAAGTPVTSQQVWDFLETMYNMEKVEEIERKHETEVMLAAAKKKAKADAEFSLPKREFGAVIAEMRREGKIGNRTPNVSDSDGEENSDDNEVVTAAAAAQPPSSSASAVNTPDATPAKKGTKRPTRSTPGSAATPAKRRRT